MKFTNCLFIGAMALAIAGISSCSGSSKQADSTIDSIAPAAALSVDSVMADPSALAGDTITIEGLCTHLCKHGGRKAFLANADTTKMIRCEATPAIGGAFSPDCVGKTLTVRGTWQAQTMGRNQLAQIVEKQAAENDGHCDTEQKASGSAAEWLKNLDEQIAAGGDTTIVVGYYLEATSYSVPVE